MSEAALLDGKTGDDGKAAPTDAGKTPAQGAAPADGGKPAEGGAGEPDWRAPFLKAFEGDDKALAKAKRDLEAAATPKDFYKVLDDNRTALRESGRVKMPGKDATPEERDAWSKALGRPEKPDGYGLNLTELWPSDVPLEDTDRLQIDKLTGMLHAEGGEVAAPATVRAAVKILAEFKSDALAAIEANGQIAADKAKIALQKEWGSDYKSNLAMATGALNHFFGAEGVAALSDVRLADGSKLLDNPEFAKGLARIGRHHADDPVFVATTTLASNDPSSLESELRGLQKNRYGTASEKEQYARDTAPGGRIDVLTRKLDAIRSAKAA